MRATASVAYLVDVPGRHHSATESADGGLPSLVLADGHLRERRTRRKMMRGKSLLSRKNGVCGVNVSQLPFFFFVYGSFRRLAGSRVGSGGDDGRGGHSAADVFLSDGGKDMTSRITSRPRPVSFAAVHRAPWKNRHVTTRTT